MLKLSHGVMFRVPIEVPDRDPLVGDLVSSPEKVGSSMEKREDAFLVWIYLASREMGPGKMQDRVRGRGWGHGLRNGEHETPDGVLDPVAGWCWVARGRDGGKSSLQRCVSFRGKLVWEKCRGCGRRHIGLNMEPDSLYDAPDSFP